MIQSNKSPVLNATLTSIGEKKPWWINWFDAMDQYKVK